MPQDLWKRIDKIFNQGTTYREVILKEGNSPIVICNCDDDDVDTLDAVFTGEEDVNDLIFPSPFVYSTDTILGYGHIDMITETFATGLITGNTINIETEKRVVKVTTFKCFSYNDPKPKERTDNYQCVHYSSHSSLLCAIEKLGRPNNILIFVRNGKK